MIMNTKDQKIQTIQRNQKGGLREIRKSKVEEQSVKPQPRPIKESAVKHRF